MGNFLIFADKEYDKLYSLVIRDLIKMILTEELKEKNPKICIKDNDDLIINKKEMAFLCKGCKNMLENNDIFESFVDENIYFNNEDFDRKSIVKLIETCYDIFNQALYDMILYKNKKIFAKWND